MINFFEILFLHFNEFFLLLILFFILSFFWRYIFKFFCLKPYNNVQRVHEDEISRLGGLVIYIILLLISFLNPLLNHFLFVALLAAIPFTLVSLKEDLFHNTSPIMRLLSMFISCILFFYFFQLNFPELNILSSINISLFFPFDYLFFTFCILVVMNGSNLIDGMNGLFAFSVSLELLTIGILSYYIGDNEVFYTTIILIIPILFFLFFNVFGKIFIGDLGAYLYGFLVACLIIYFFGNNQELLSWGAVLIVFYPCIELLFSYVRKISSGKSPMSADNMHLHTLIYKKIERKFLIKKYANSCVTLILSVLWLTPLYSLVLFLNNIFLIYVLLVLNTIFYISFYYLIKRSSLSK